MENNTHVPKHQPDEDVPGTGLPDVLFEKSCFSFTKCLAPRGCWDRDITNVSSRIPALMLQWFSISLVYPKKLAGGCPGIQKAQDMRISQEKKGIVRENAAKFRKSANSNE
jgi:hypothetical protein